MGEMTQNMQKHWRQMNTLFTFSIDVMHMHTEERANRFHRGLGPFGPPTSHNANAGPVQLPGLPLARLLPSNHGTHSPQNMKVDSHDLELPGNCNPHAKKQQRTEG